MSSIAARVMAACSVAFFLLGGTAGEPAGGVFGLDRPQQARHDHGIAGDIPARLDAEPLMRRADMPDRLEVGLVESPRRDCGPVLDLGLFGAPDRRVIREQSGKTRNLGEMRVELVENRRQGPGNERLQFAQRSPCRGVDPDEFQTRSQGLFVVHRFLHGLMGAT